MEFNQYKCPVCDQSFKSDDDVVVCPECGTPHHRECYENSGHCYYEDKHSEDFSFESNEHTHEQEQSDFTVCPQCQTENEKTSFYCNKCGFPLNERDRNNADSNRRVNTEYNNTNNTQGMPFGFGAAGMPVFDPLAGLDSEDEIADNVKVGEAAKFIGKTTQYFLMVFNKIKKWKHSRFNFSAMIFAEVYFLYRKMTAIGVIISLVMMATTVASAAIMMSPDWIASYNNLVNLSYSGVRVSVFSPEFSFMYLPLALQGLRLVIRVLSGLFANKLYYKHCTKKINEIKNNKEVADINKTLEAKGGVNLPLAVSFYAASMVISFICNYISETGFF